MMNVTPLGPLSDAAISDFEQTFAITLPTSYRDWLLATGGGSTDRDYGVGNAVISEFLTLHGEGGYDLPTERSTTTGFSAFVPRQWLVITAGTGGDLAVMLEGDDAGSVWFADYDVAADLGGDAVEDEAGNALPLPQIMSRLADSLPAFLQDYAPSNEAFDD